MAYPLPHSRGFELHKIASSPPALVCPSSALAVRRARYTFPAAYADNALAMSPEEEPRWRVRCHTPAASSFIGRPRINLQSSAHRVRPWCSLRCTRFSCNVQCVRFAANRRRAHDSFGGSLPEERRRIAFHPLAPMLVTEGGSHRSASASPWILEVAAIAALGCVADHALGGSARNTAGIAASLGSACPKNRPLK